jgi:hypothetical protein
MNLEVVAVLMLLVAMAAITYHMTPVLVLLLPCMVVLVVVPEATASLATEASLATAAAAATEALLAMAAAAETEASLATWLAAVTAVALAVGTINVSSLARHLKLYTHSRRCSLLPCVCCCSFYRWIQP